jgi:uncharacterized membrane protein YhaH (DUF805 family)
LAIYIVTGGNTPLGRLAALASDLVLLIPTTAVSVRRLHDKDHSGWWLLGPTGLLAVSMQLGSFNPTLRTAAGVLIIIDLALFLWIVVTLAMPGSAGINRFGSPSNAPAEPPVAVGGHRPQHQGRALDSSDAGPGPDKRTAAEASAPVPPPSAVAGATMPQQYEAKMEEDFYVVAGRELETGARDVGAWARALAISGGDQMRTQAEYIRIRVAALEAEAQVAREAQEVAAAQAALAAAELEHKVRTYADAQGVSMEEAAQMMPHGISKQGGLFRFRNYSYAKLEDAVAAASNWSEKLLGWDA